MAALLRDVHGDFNTVVRGVFEEEENELEDQKLRSYLLVHQMGDEASERYGNQLEIRSE